jgi:aspartate/methionine/tyrosine aminotransferase
MNALAEELNRTLAGSVASRLLSEMGKRMYFPKGIISQSAEAGEKAYRFNATIGMACAGGHPLILDSMRAGLPTLSPEEAVSYASTSGSMPLRKRWRAELDRKNPSLRGKLASLPVVAPGLTAGISFVADLFLDADDEAVMPDLYWPNYKLVVEERKGASGRLFAAFALGADGAVAGLNVAGLEAALRDAGKRSAARGGSAKAVCILNFPNNPTGYTPTLEEADAVVAALVRIAADGTAVLAVVDDAYFGLQYEEGLLAESIFARLADAHPNILAVKVDGPTKEDYVWGFRLGFVTFASAGLGGEALEALVKKLMGVIRSSVSSSSTPAQSLLLKSLDDPRTEAQKARFRAALEERYRLAKRFLAARALPPSLKALPFNSGYFMSFECFGFSAEELRKKLLDERGIGTVSMQDRYLRVAFSGVDADGIDELFSEIAAAARELGTGSEKAVGKA